MLSKLFKKIRRKFLPKSVNVLIGACGIVIFKYRPHKGVKSDVILNNENYYLPWYTYPAIEYLQQYDYSDKSIIEWGSGNSTFFWAKKAKELVSIEDDFEWYKKVYDRKPKNVNIIHAKDRLEYTSVLNKLNRTFDVIIVDGKYRHECLSSAVKHLNKNGFILFDNSDWFPDSCALLRKADLIQVDFCGLGPLNEYTWCTSLFLNREFSFKRLINSPRPVGFLEENVGKII